MDIQFQGFDPAFSWLLLFLLACLSVAVSWWSYSGKESLSSYGRAWLVALRASSLLLLLILLANPALQTGRTLIEQPAVAVYLDNSQSMTIQRGVYEGRESYTTILEEVADGWPGDLEVGFYSFGNEILPVTPLELSLDEPVTDLDQVILHAQQLPGNTVAALLLSDGILTRGRDPVYRADGLQFPVFTVPVGDTAQVRDLAIRDLLTPETGALGTHHPVEVVVTQQGADGEAVTLRLFHDDYELEQREVSFGNGRTTVTESFELEFDEEGVHHFEARVDEIDGELTAENNRYPFSVRVLDRSRTVYHLAYEIHPDVAFLRSLLLQDPEIELRTLTWLGDRFMETSTVTAEPEFDPGTDLVILHGSPPAGVPFDIGSVGDRSSIQFLLPSRIPPAEEWIVPPAELRQVSQGWRVRPELITGERDHPLLDIQQPLFERFPALSAAGVEVDLPSSATVLYESRHDGQIVSLPLLYTEEAGNVRRAVVTAGGWYRYRQSSDESVRRFASDFMQSLLSWTARPPDSDSFEITPGRYVYREGEEISFQAFARSETTGRPLPDAAVTLHLVDETGSEQTYVLRHQAEGAYRVRIPSLSAGVYEYRGEALRGGRSIGTDGGEITVTPSPVELVDTRRDDRLLERLASATGGLLIPEPFELESFLRELENRALLEERETRATEYRSLYSWPPWFFLLLVLLGSEWILRRRFTLD